MAQLAKLKMWVEDESFYGAGTGAIIPLYIIATESNKVLDSTYGKIAPGTSMANELLVMTSQRDVVDTFGVPYFEESDGTVMQGSELNEVGLLGLYDAMGSSALGYAVRADIDMGQLKPSSVAPTSSVENGYKWLDAYVSSFGVYRCNGGNSPISTQNWDYVDVQAVDELPEVDGEGKTVQEGKIVFLTEKENNGGSFFENLGGWKLIGSDEWSDEFEEPVDVTFSSHLRVPSGKKQGSIWIKTTQPSNGSKYVKKVYNSAIQSWTESVMPFFGSYLEAEGSVTVTKGTDVVFYNSDVASVRVEKFLDSDTVYITGTSEVSEQPFKGKIGIYTRYTDEPVKVEIKSDDEGEVSAETAVSLINKRLREEGINSIVASIVDNRFVMESLDGYTVQLKNEDENNTLSKLGVADGVISDGSWEQDTDIMVSVSEPRKDPKEGTMWFDNADKVDIMVNDGTKWVGLKEMSGYTPELYITSEEPSENVSDMSVWVDTNMDSYPTIYRYFNGMWNLVDNTDQTSALGIVFGDARYYAGTEDEPTFEINEKGIVESNLLTSSIVDPDAPDAKSYPKDILLFNTRFSSKNVKEYKENPFKDIYPESSYRDFPSTARWVTRSGNALNGAGLFGNKAQRKVIVDALNGAVKSCEELKSVDYDFFYACCPGYPEVDVALNDLNSDKKEMFYIVSDTPKTLEPTARAITDWAANRNNGEHGEESRTIRSEYMTRQYPPMGMSSNVDGTSVAIPTSIVKMNNLLNLPTGQICAGTQFGVVSNIGSVGYISDEDEYKIVSVNDGLGEVITAQSMNPIMVRRNTGLLFWGENTEYNVTSSLSDEHAILTLLRLKRELEVAVQPFFFKKNTQAVRNDFDRVIRNILTSYVSKEELYDFALDTETPNTAETIERKELHANIAIEIVKGIEFIFLPIRVVNTGSLSDTTVIA